MGYSPWSRKESDMTERVTLSLFHCKKKTWWIKTTELYSWTVLDGG